MSPAQRRMEVRRIGRRMKVSERAACRALSQPRSSQRYEAQQRNGEKGLCRRMRELALRHPRYGYRRVGALLREEGFKVNVKKINRLWRLEGLKVPQKQQKRRRMPLGSSDRASHRMRALRMNQVWSFDFCHDRTADGKGLKIFSVIDEFTRRCLAIEVRRRMTGVEVVSILGELTRVHGVPDHIRCDNGPEFVCAAVKGWLKRSKVSALYIAPGSPWENAYAESYHARLRDEMLEREEFGTLLQAKGLLEIWREQYNNERPHGALGYVTPQAFAESCRRDGPGSAPLRPARHDEQARIEKSVAQ